MKKGYFKVVFMIVIAIIFLFVGFNYKDATGSQTLVGEILTIVGGGILGFLLEKFLAFAEEADLFLIIPILLNWNKNIQPFTVADLQKKLYEERRSLRGLRKKVRSHESYEGKSEEEKQLVKAELKTAILKSKAVVSKTRYDLAMVSKEIKLSERKFKVDRTVAMSKIKAILAKNTWIDFQK